MEIKDFPVDMQPFMTPHPLGDMSYQCLGCKKEHGIGELLYTCPNCGSILMLHDEKLKGLRTYGGSMWRKVFDYRRMLNQPWAKGIFRYYEFIAPVIPLQSIVYLGEGHTSMVQANKQLQEMIGLNFYFKNDGQNPSASFKDRGMACALSYINYLAKEQGLDILAICASTGDTSASAALYSSYLGNFIKSAVLLPQGKVTPQQLAQPLGSGATVLEIPGVFDDCMKVVESLADNYHIALLNSKNAWRILGQESFSFEISQDFDYQIGDKVVVMPIGNAGNITAIISGFLKFFKAGIIDALPKIVGVQSENANPVYRYYLEDDPKKRRFEPVTVKPSVAQAAMIGNPVSMPRVVKLVTEYNQAAGEKRVFVVQVSEQEIMDSMIIANRNGNIACTQGGESLAGIMKAVKSGIVTPKEIGIVDSTAHALKFQKFQDMYFNDCFGPEFNVRSRPELTNAPQLIRPESIQKFPEPGKPLEGENMKRFVEVMSREIAEMLNLQRK